MPNTFDSMNSEKLNSFLFQYQLHFCANPVQFTIYIVKVNFIMTYLTEVTQSQFEIGLDQEEQEVYQISSRVGHSL